MQFGQTNSTMGDSIMNEQPLISINNEYKRVTQEICNRYYQVYDSDFRNLTYLYTAMSKFTFQDEEVVGFNNLYSKWINKYGIQKFTHNIKFINSQPVSDKTLLINVHGLVRVNDNLTQTQYQPFSETLLVQRGNTDNTFRIYNTMFRLLV